MAERLDRLGMSRLIADKIVVIRRCSKPASPTSPGGSQIEQRLFRGVAEGEYAVHIPSSTEVRKRVLGLLPDGPEFEGADVPFTVKLASPHQLDLGNIPLKERP